MEENPDGLGGGESLLGMEGGVDLSLGGSLDDEDGGLGGFS